MQILVNSGNSVNVDNRTIEWAEAIARESLGRWEDRLTRLEIHLNDLNSDSKSGAEDKRCQIEARPRGMDPVSASHDADSLEGAMRGAVRKLERLLDSTFGRLADRR